MAVVLTYATGVPVVKVGRIAGPVRQAPLRRARGDRRGRARELPRPHGQRRGLRRRGADARTPGGSSAPTEQSAATLNLLRAFTKGGFADLSRVHAWNQEFVVDLRTRAAATPRIADEIERAMAFMRACGIDLEREHPLHEVDFFTSHEALVLNYEEALTRRDSLTGDWYDCSAHLVWIGERTRQPDGAHVEFASGIANPIACKLGPTATPAEAVALAERLDPDRTPGRLTFVTRLGADARRGRRSARSSRRSSPRATRSCGRATRCTATRSPLDSGRKTRRFDDILSEIRGFFAVHRALGTWPGGVHVELTGARGHRVPRAAPRRSARATSTRTTPRSATRGSTRARASTSPSRSPSSFGSSAPADLRLGQREPVVVAPEAPPARGELEVGHRRVARRQEDALGRSGCRRPSPTPAATTPPWHATTTVSPACVAARSPQRRAGALVEPGQRLAARSRPAGPARRSKSGSEKRAIASSHSSPSSSPGSCSRRSWRTTTSRSPERGGRAARRSRSRAAASTRRARRCPRAPRRRPAAPRRVAPGRGRRR